MDNKKRSKKTVADTVCRVHKFGGYAVLSNCFVRSTNLGCPAIGLLGRVLALPPEWNFTKAGLIAVCADGETAVESALADLEKWGYVKKTIQINIGYLTANRTSAGDEVYTPFYAVEPLMEFLPKDKKIWCPFDEEWSAFYQLLSEKGYDVTRSSLREGKDFFHFEPENWDILVSNPPFSKKNEVLKRAYQLGKPFALLLPVNSIQGKARYKIFKNEIQMLGFDARVDYHTRQNMQTYTKGNHFGSAYFCRNLLPSKLELRQLIKYDRPLQPPTGGDEKWE